MNIHIQRIAQSKTVRGVLLGIGIVLCVLAIFEAGTFVGHRRALFSARMGENYYRAFDGEKRGGPMNDLMGFKGDSEFMGSHGATGKIVRVSLPTFVVAGPDNTEKVVTINDRTLIRSMRANASTSDLIVDRFVVVLGQPNDLGEIEAKLIRFLPPPPTVTATPSPNK